MSLLDDPNVKVRTIEPRWRKEREAKRGRRFVKVDWDYLVTCLNDIGTERCLRIKGDFKETTGANPMTCKSTMVVREKDGAAVKGTYVMTNVEFQPGMPPTNATATMTLL